MKATTQRKRRRPPGGDDGFSTLELAIIGPVIMLLFCTVLQLGLYFLASSSAHSAARKGAAAAAAYEASPADGITRARDYVDQVGMVKGVAISSAGSTADRVRITVHGQAPSLVPGWTWDISQSAELPVERFEVTP
ncbi:pilus assembly protein [Streptomyces sp. T-3]|nr:pilus assembly protein [Streptomyces sp. T-3]